MGVHWSVETYIVVKPFSGSFDRAQLGSNQGRLERTSKYQGVCGLPEERAASGRHGEGSVQASRPEPTPAENPTLVKNNRAPKRTEGVKNPKS